MRDERGTLEGDVELEDELELRGMVTGNMTVRDGATLVLRGMICKNLAIDAGATVFLYGTVVGNVVNNGGALEVFGTIEGSLQRRSGTTVVSPDASVRLDQSTA